jgi:hypothetical protein
VPTIQDFQQHPHGKGWLVARKQSKRRNKKLTYSPRDINNISWGLFCFPHLPGIPLALMSSSPIHHCPHSVVHHCWLLAPVIHCMSSGSQGWGQVLGCLLSLAHSCSGGWGMPIVVPLFIVVTPLHIIISPHSSTCEQLLSHPHCSSSHYPPCE